jgi:hypothetical protein
MQSCAVCLAEKCWALESQHQQTADWAPANPDRMNDLGFDFAVLRGRPEKAWIRRKLNNSN